jgi:hypothetical protein
MAKLTRITKEREGERRPTRYFSKKQEDSVASALSGRRNSNSGAGMWQKGDVTTDNFLLECKTKTTHSESISVKKEWIEKNRKEAFFMNKDYCAVVINFGPDEPNYYIIDEELFAELQEYLKNKN